MTDPVVPAAAVASAEPQSREVRVFLSSTFRDFMDERDLLVKQVFPSLRRRAQDRGVEVVDVDLRWGITEEESQQGNVIGICLAEIERCRPYFVGMLGERYGWTPQQGDYLPELLEREQLQWLKGYQGAASVTELEILHGVLNDQEMAGRAFFYFRDPAWSRQQTEPGFICDTLEEEARLADLKQRIRGSRFPVVENLATPQAIADQIAQDLWDLIDQQFPAQEQPDALEKEARKHADYRRSRTGAGQYVGGEAYIQQLEQWLAAGRQQILITGESGAGKSALIANWMEAHQQAHPEDVVYAHHLGCTNDANALRPLLARLIDTASAQLLEAGLIPEALAVPEDWWELVARVAETLQSLGHLAGRNGYRWIWVLDGLDRLDPDDQNALPWLPQNLPAGVQVVASALACPARTILSQRDYTTLTIEPLAAAEQELLIQRYLQRYTKELDGGLRQQILRHPLAGSPLFLKVLLEELRQCGRHDTLKEQLDFYLSSQTIDDLYERVLERLENDGCGENVRRVMTALWASRAGLSEPELLAITGLAPLQWAPIDLALEKAFGRNGNRLVFDHDFLRTAVGDRYLPTEEQRRQAHSDLADWYEAKEGWDERDAEELPWQWQQADRLKDLREHLLNPVHLAYLCEYRGSRETINYWLAARGDGGADDGELDELIAEDLEAEIEKRREDAEDLIWFLDRIAALLDEVGLYREPLLKLRTLSLVLEEASEDRSEESMLVSLNWLADAQRDLGQYDAALPLYQRCLEAQERLLGPEHPSTLTTVGNLAGLYQDKGEYEQAEAFYSRALEARERLLGPEHPSTLTTVNNLALLYQDKGEYEQAEAFYSRALEAQERLLGPEHPSTLTTVGNLAGLYQDKGAYEQAEAFYSRALEARERLLGPEHPSTLTTVGNLAGLYQDKGEYEQAEAFYYRDLEASERLLGPEHPSTLTTVGNLALLYQDKGDYEQAEAFYSRALEAQERLLGPEHPSTLTTVNNLAGLYQDKGEYEQAEAFYSRALEARERLVGPEHPSTLTTVGNLAVLYQAKGDYEQAEAFYSRALEAQERLVGPEHPSTLTTVGNLGLLYKAKGDYEQAEAFYSRALEGQERLVGPEHPDTLITVGNLGLLYKAKGDYEQAEAFYSRALEARERLVGPEHPDTLSTVNSLALLYQDKGDYEQAEALFIRALEARERLVGPEHPSTLTTVYNLAEVLSQLERRAEAIPLRRRELAWCREQNGDNDPGTLTSINDLAIDLRETGELEEAETLFRELVAGSQEVLEAGDFRIGRALGGLAKTLEAAGKLEEALAYRQQALDHRLAYEGPDDWWTNRGRLDLARVLQKLGRQADALALLQELQVSMDRIDEPDDDDQALRAEADALLSARQ
ncbi:tetratricopeptide repeat protein [Synechococcus sp. CBW1006]|uniref:tetratricopeptide repeat protein n=1 Tax=Synechococcus sp. CBW1006 TaxID=1353138 RepID=UPI0018CCC45F|nr:tetratricopeptide repeat protein [Synechococcus sp. CBW1006]QPN66566.1 tetratricopeptide repeat protein [Synechococcus sp. CBW1006]